MRNLQMTRQFVPLWVTAILLLAGTALSLHRSQATVTQAASEQEVYAAKLKPKVLLPLKR